MDTIISEEPVAFISKAEDCFSVIKIGAMGSSEILVSIYQTAWCQITEGSNLDTHSHKNLKSNITLQFIKVFLYLQFAGLDIANIAVPLQSIAMELCTHKSGNSVMLMRTFVEGIQDIIDVSPSLHLSEHTLIGKFIKDLVLKLTKVIFLIAVMFHTFLIPQNSLIEAVFTAAL
jgi:hypothetical protein